MIIDTHVHYNLEPLFSNNKWIKLTDLKDKKPTNEAVQKYGILKRNGDDWFFPKNAWEDHWRNAQNHEVKKSIVVGIDRESISNGGLIVMNHPNLFFAFGFHPSTITNLVESWSTGTHYNHDIEDWLPDSEEMKYSADRIKRVAIGEVGLDYYHLPSDVSTHDRVKTEQKKAFKFFIKVAQLENLPLILHVRDKEVPEKPTKGNAYWDALEILQKYDVKNFTLHCVSGPLSYVKSAIEMGGYMGFDGNITYPNAQHIREIFKLVPEDRRLVETDAPFLPPQEFRGKTCEPWMISKTVEFLEKELKVDSDSFADNAMRLFNLT